MTASVMESRKSPSLTNGTKQGCVVAPVLFAIYFSAMLMVAFAHLDTQYRTDGSVFNLQWLKARTKIREHVLRDLLFADNCALIAHTIEDTHS